MRRVTLSVLISIFLLGIENIGYADISLDIDIDIGIDVDIDVYDIDNHDVS